MRKRRHLRKEIVDGIEMTAVIGLWVFLLAYGFFTRLIGF